MAMLMMPAVAVETSRVECYLRETSENSFGEGWTDKSRGAASVRGDAVSLFSCVIAEANARLASRDCCDELRLAGGHSIG